MSVLLSVTVLRFIFKLLFFLLVVAAIVCPNKCYLLTYLFHGDTERAINDEA
jgi:hypothetical protein